MPPNQPNDKDFAFRPFYEKARAILDSLGGFAMHPQQQSQLAMQIAQQMILDNANSARAGSPLDPSNRPGVPAEALPASSQPAGPLTQTAQPQPPPIQF